MKLGQLLHIIKIALDHAPCQPQKKSLLRYFTQKSRQKISNPPPEKEVSTLQNISSNPQSSLPTFFVNCYRSSRYMCPFSISTSSFYIFLFKKCVQQILLPLQIHGTVAYVNHTTRHACRRKY